MTNTKIVKLRKIVNDTHDFIEYGVEKDGIIRATIYQGIDFWGRTKTMKNLKDWKWIVRSVDEKKAKYIYESFSYFKDARNRAIEIANNKI
ncbi:MAG: hypothetical protein WDA59_08190 [Methanofastidiosum sp.]|jgi:hypothetical protein|nr:hypothetical protein [Candidatus Izemoplasmatales bacterium]